MSVVFERPRGFVYDAGDWMDIESPSVSLRGGKTYSFSSAPTERELVITFREGISPFKRALQAVRPGERLRMSQYGNYYDFRLRGHSSSLLVAGGVGVAPFRSMVKQMADEGSKGSVKLLYFNQAEDFLFRQEFDRWQSDLPGFAVDYVVTKDLKRKDREKLFKPYVASSSQSYYVAGPPGMVSGTMRVLESLGVGHDDIRIDSFDGY